MNDLKAQDSGMLTARAGEVYKSIESAPLDGVPVKPTVIQFDYRVYQDEQELWRKTAKRVEDLFRSEAGKLEMARDAIKNMEHHDKVRENNIHQIMDALKRGRIKLIPLRNNKGYRAVILKRKPKKK